MICNLKGDTMTKQNLSAFVIMPFDPEFDSIYSDLIKPALENIGYEVIRADSLVNQHNILKDIVRHIAFANIVVADLTAINPNVFYELGIAHALQKPTILLTQSIDEVPFDLRAYRIITYSTRFDEIKKLSETLSKLGDKAKIRTLDFSNPVIDFLPPEEIHLETKLKKNSQHQVEEPLTDEEMKEEKGLWDFVVDGEAAMKKVGEILNGMTEATKKIGERMSTRTAEFEKINQSGTPGSSSRIYSIIELTARDILSYGKQTENYLPKLHDSWETFSESATGMFRTTTIKTTEDKVAAEQFRSQLKQLSEAISGGLNGTKEFRDSQAKLRGISRSMNRASRKTTSALDRVISELKQAVSYCSKVIDLLDEMLREYEIHTSG